MDEKILYHPHEIHDGIQDGSIITIDVRDAPSYHKGHVPGAINIPEVFWYLSRSTPEGLRELQDKFKKIFSEAGLTREKTVIFYEDCLETRYGGSCRGYWLLRYLGQERCGILYAGLSAWAEAGLPMERGDFYPKPTEFEIQLRPEIIATRDDVLQAIDSSSVVLLDNRDRAEWIGASSSPYGLDFAPRKGRIPGAKWIEWYEFMDLSGQITKFRSKEDILETCAKKGIHPDDDIIIYCFKGARASNTFVAMKKAGFKKLRNYFASWNEWSRDPSLPIET